MVDDSSAYNLEIILGLHVISLKQMASNHDSIDPIHHSVVKLHLVIKNSMRWSDPLLNIPVERVEESADSPAAVPLPVPVMAVPAVGVG